jgi:hypothetical protein
MFKRFRPTPSGVIATIALVLAMSGGAYAAKRYLITSTKQISPTVLKALKGVGGKTGATGAIGPAGPAGSVGPTGAAGSGTAGPAGLAGPAGPQGKEGEKGAKGTTGSPWTAGGTLPAGATETGVWTLGEVPSTGVFVKTSISFSIPLAAPITNAEECGEAGKPACVVHVFKGTTMIPSGCEGTVVGASVTGLKADAGNFCMWIMEKEGFNKGNAELLPEDPESEGSIGVGTHGATVTAVSEEGANAQGIWAVTG